jgi:serine/threonine protein kinase
VRSGPLTRLLFDAIGAQLVLAEFGGEPPRVGDDYVIEAIVGAGGFGLICRATSRALQRRVALKLYPLGGDEDSGVREALREARSLARLEHPGIVGVYAAGESELRAGTRLPCAFVEMQYVEGRTLRTWLADGALGSDEVIRVLLEAGRALAHAHASGVVHRDFKPENVMVDRADRARVIDFGLALATERVDTELADWSPEGDVLGSRATGTGLVRGTPGYMAPEVSQGMPRAASDQFAFAIVVREALTGEHPFQKAGEARVEPPTGGLAAFARIKPAIDRAMAPSPADRFESVTELCDAIERALGRAAPRRSRRPLVLLGALGLSGAAALAVLSLDRDRERPESAGTPTPERHEPEPEPEPEPASEPEPEVAEPILPGSCNELEAWAGAWEIGGEVAWTEYVYQLDWWLAYRLELDVGSECRVHVLARKYRPRIEGEPLGEFIETEVEVLAIRDPDGVWRLPLRLGFAEDTNTYGKDEYYDLILQLDRVDGRERVVGGFRRVDSEGNPIRTGRLLGHRGITPTLAALDGLELGCHARCRIECAGASAERACIERGCEDDPDGSDDVCGAPSVDYQIPLRARVAGQAVARGESLLENSLEQGSRTKLLAACSDNARGVAGRWSIDWVDAEARTGRITVELASDGCRLDGNAEVDGESTPLTGEVTVAGTWLLTPSTPTSWLPSAMILVGVGREAPAFGIDVQEPPRRLRAHRRP